MNHSRTLQNKRILLTGAADSSLSLAQSLAQQGALVQSTPMIEIYTAENSLEIKQKISELHTYQWILFTSKYGVSSFFSLLSDNNATIPTNIKLACVGNKTAEKLATFGYSANFTCSKNNGIDFAQEFSDFCKNEPVLVFFPTGNLTQNMIALAVSPTITITKCITYNTVPPQHIHTDIIKKIQEKLFDYIIFTSPSGVINFITICNCTEIWQTTQAVSIGPATTKQLQACGVTNIVQAQEYNSEGIIKILQ